MASPSISDQRDRALHALENLEAATAALRYALKTDPAVGRNLAQTVGHQSVNVVMAVARLDEAVRAEQRHREKKPACSTCDDTHRMRLRGREVACTQCPAPCARCRAGKAPFCETTPCACDCHAPKEAGRG